MKKPNSSHVGWYATALYLGGLLCVMAARHEELLKLCLNELGDFLAGAFGPLAFAWLVLGFIQQGKELRLSSEALILQAAELKNSVGQQADIAASQKSNITNYENAVEPLLKISCDESGWDGEHFYCRLNIENMGDYCESLKVLSEVGGVELSTIEIHSMFSGESSSYQFLGMNEWEDFTVQVSYVSRVGRPNTQTFSVKAANDDDSVNPFFYYVVKLPFLAVTQHES